MYTLRFTENVKEDNNPAIESSVTIEASGRTGLDESFGASADQLMEIDFLVANVKGVYIKASQDCTLETNSSSAPSNTINLLANKPYLWYTGNLNTLKFTVDVTKFYITALVAGTIKAVVLYDATP